MKKNKKTIMLLIIAFGICLFGLTLIIYDKCSNESLHKNLSLYGLVAIFIGLIANHIVKNKGFGWRTMWGNFMKIFKL